MGLTSPPELKAHFQLISDPSEKIRILYDLIDGHVPIVSKPVNSKSELFSLEASSVIGGSLLIFCKDPRFETHPSKDTLIVQFLLGNEKYMAQVPCHKVSSKNHRWALDMSHKLFRVQRREFFRLTLPLSFQGVLTVTELEGVPFNQSFHIVDLSGGGCRIHIPPLGLQFKTGIPFRGILKVPKQDEIQLECVARYQNAHPLRPTATFLGIQFLHRTPSEANRIVSIVMDLYREYFSRF